MSDDLMNYLRRGITGTAFSLLAACSGGGGSGVGTSFTGTQSNCSVHLVGGPGDGVQSLSLAIQKVEVNGPSGWVTVASPNAAYSLPTLVDGSSGTLAANFNLAAGAYTALRLTLGQGSTAQLIGGNTLPLTSVAPVFLIPCSFAVSTNVVDITMVIDPGRSVQPRGGTLRFAPEWRVVDRNSSGTISGKLTDGAGLPLAGALVTAQYFPAFGDPAILRRALTHADGSYQLDLLPFGTACYAVCFPQVSGKVFDPKASAPFTPQAGAASATFNTAFSSRTDLSSTSGTVAPITNAVQGDEVYLVFGSILAGGVSESFIIGTSPGVLAGNVETWAFPRLPAGSTYHLRATRRTWAADGTSTLTRKFSDDYGFLANFNFSYDFSF